MIKLERGERPKELTDEVCEELKKLYAEDRDKDVWNSTKIKKPLKEAMLDMSHGKCSYCECKLGIESKDATERKARAKNELSTLVMMSLKNI